MTPTQINTPSPKEQAKITAVELFNKGYTGAAAARALGCSRSHVNQVLNGKRESKPLMLQLIALPRQEPRFREALTPKHPSLTA